VVIVAAFIVLFVLKNLIVNAILGIAALLVAKFVFGVPVPLTAVPILVCAIGGLWGAGAIFIASYAGWLN
ncbi:MAG: transcriptional regulator, partial [Candidatus Micrarchaeota archaeon]